MNTTRNTPFEDPNLNAESLLLKEPPALRPTARLIGVVVRTLPVAVLLFMPMPMAVSVIVRTDRGRLDRPPDNPDQDASRQNDREGCECLLCFHGC
jgi:hypothetical protein